MIGELVLGAIALVEFVAICLGVVGAVRYHSETELGHQSERAQLINAWTLERASLLDRIQAGDVEQYHALQRAYVEQQMEVPVTRWDHDEFGFMSQPHVPEGEQDSL